MRRHKKIKKAIEIVSDENSKLIDTFIFYNELDILEFRLEELYDYVDYFIICEALYTHAGNKKELFYKNNEKRYNKYKDKIIYLLYEGNFDRYRPYENEAKQRNHIREGIEKLNLKNNDIIMHSDCDEIPNINNIIKEKNKGINGCVSLKTEVYYYNLFTRHGNCTAHKIFTYSFFSIYKNLTAIRFKMKFSKFIENGGWHFSYFGDADFIFNKINNFSAIFEKGLNINKITKEQIEERVKNKQDIFLRNDKKYLEITEERLLPKNYKMLL